MKPFALSLQYPRENGSALSVYWPPSYNNLIIFFEELTKSVRMGLSAYGNIIVMGDFNIDINKDAFCEKEYFN